MIGSIHIELLIIIRDKWISSHITHVNVTVTECGKIADVFWFYCATDVDQDRRSYYQACMQATRPVHICATCDTAPACAQRVHVARYLIPSILAILL